MADAHVNLTTNDAGGTPTCDSRLNLPPCAIVIFGASGDLTARKLFPALFSLHRSGHFPESFVILGCSRSELDDDQFRARMREAVERSGDFERQAWETMAPRLYYQQVSYEDAAGYAALAARLDDIDRVQGTRGNRLFYLAVPPTLYETIAACLGETGLAVEHGESFSRIVVEKPFGHDLRSAQALDAILHRSFGEPQVFRIDHYLAKETVQNILMFRFANAIFEPVWNRNHIDYISVIAAENLGVEHRAGYYDKAGVLRDMFQNHMMQLLALAAMDAPTCFHADRVRDEKVRLYRGLKPFEVADEFKDLVLGQYGPGMIDGKHVVAYRDEKGVDPRSLTPTFAMIRAFVDNWRWKGVPFFLTSGKRLARKASRIVVQFKDVPHSMLHEVAQERLEANQLVFGIYPDEVIHMSFMAKLPAPRLCLRPVVMHYGFDDAEPGPRLEAYEKVLLDCILGDHMLFWRQDGVEQTWGFLTPILEMCETCGELERHLHSYPAGSWGPERAVALHPGFARDVSMKTSEGEA
ncbi:glucose-6-phosphate dehydrogenase [Desulfocurvibacter africanus]|uniref:Glucose-6-phosphate 1-dehydrogenase n=1 Tax=Desulfocurvibacter africanus subsp. africanus str. Walvis Bay TaxID=690850 RepID=F3YTS0_DESAF|nr:glucose-6-phosphate dehydrogenase [Desulfocurvibacter africanus]EGJ48451.1 glucose-6-phosphate 1-dehydrogenase [Desulfocurvibacter africanus subsp. africanus str. Walvis Bay]